jgi:predicted transposase/invertase (TIGR01784 family)
MAAHNPHNRFAQAIFTDPAQAEVVLRAVLPPEVLAHLDFTQAELQPSLFTDEELTERRSDFLFKVPMAGEDAYVLVLLEHQSSVDRLMAARVLVYVGRAIDRHLLHNPTAKSIPAVIPVVLYHGEEGWTAATELFDLYALPEDAKPALRPVLPSLRFLLDDLSQTQDEDLRQRPGPVLARLALIVLRHAQELRTAKDPAATLLALATAVGDLLQQVADRTGRTVVFRYMLEIIELEPEEGRQILLRALPDKVKEDIVTAADQLRAEGRAEGEVKTLRRVLLRLLREKFTTLPVEAEQRIAAANADELDAWTTRVLKASSLNEVFADS